MIVLGFNQPMNKTRQPMIIYNYEMLMFVCVRMYVNRCYKRELLDVETRNGSPRVSDCLNRG